MFEGNWKCSGCGGTITSLPFEPRSEEGLTCRDCYQKQKGGGGDTAPAAASGERKMFEGNWTCAECGTAITQLPFEPREGSSLKCLDCFKKSKG